jgi:MFS superfamily sulfate permease-like transporter
MQAPYFLPHSRPFLPSSLSSLLIFTLALLGFDLQAQNIKVHSSISNIEAFERTFSSFGTPTSYLGKACTLISHSLIKLHFGANGLLILSSNMKTLK